MAKNILTFVALLLAVATSSAQEVVKTTHHYATKEGIELLLDRYDIVAAGDNMRPCMIFLFGGGFKQGERNNKMYI